MSLIASRKTEEPITANSVHYFHSDEDRCIAVSVMGGSVGGKWYVLEPFVPLGHYSGVMIMVQRVSTPCSLLGILTDGKPRDPPWLIIVTSPSRESTFPGFDAYWAKRQQDASRVRGQPRKKACLIRHTACMCVLVSYTGGRRATGTRELFQGREHGQAQLLIQIGVFPDREDGVVNEWAFLVFCNPQAQYKHRRVKLRRV